MTPKQKAEDLIHQYRMMLMDYGDDYGEEILVSILSSRCALIAIDLHLEELSKMKLIFSDREIHYKYWKEIKQEIEKL
jgi:hypothetical protein